METFRIGHSPDPDDAFMYYAIAHDKVAVGDRKVVHVLEEIESLNKRALTEELECTAISAAAYPLLADKYRIMSTGASIGRNYGPIVVANKAFDLQGAHIAIPGLHTTAYLLAQIYIPNFIPVPMKFDEVLPAVKDGKIEAGLIIHEGQITYEEDNLINLMDLGVKWYNDTNLPLPLGLDMIRRDLGESWAQTMQTALRDSIQYAFDHEDDAIKYAMSFGRGIDPETCKTFVKMYVNEDTLDLGTEGIQALTTLYEKAIEVGAIAEMPPLDVVQ